MILAEALLQSILWMLVDPLVFVPALALGWWARGTGMVIAGAVGIAAVLTILSLLQPLPQGAKRLAWAAPLGVIAPLLVAGAAFRLRRWLRARDAAAPRRLSTRIIRCGLGGVLGAAAGAVLFLGAGLAIVTLAGIHDREGGEGYLIALVITPLGLLIGLVAGGIVAWRRARPVAIAGLAAVGVAR